MPYQNISAELTDADQTSILDSLKEITTKMPFLINLTPDERKTLPKMGDKSVPFVRKALEYATSNPQFVPPYLHPAELTKDSALAEKLLTINNAVQVLSEKVNDTLMATGFEAYTASRTFYNSVKSAAKQNVPGADVIATDLGKRFEGQGKPKQPQQ